MPLPAVLSGVLGWNVTGTGLLDRLSFFGGGDNSCDESSALAALLPFEDAEEREFAPDALSDETSTLLVRRPCNRSRKRMPGMLARPSNSQSQLTYIFVILDI
jgi:hypothetical protein